MKHKKPLAYPISKSIEYHVSLLGHKSFIESSRISYSVSSDHISGKFDIRFIATGNHTLSHLNNSIFSSSESSESESSSSLELDSFFFFF